MADHIMKTLLNIMAALSLAAFMVLFIVLYAGDRSAQG